MREPWREGRIASRLVSLCLHMPVSEPFFPRMSPWKAALVGTVPTLVLLLTGMSYIGWREHQAKEREVKKRKKESQERDQMENEKELALKEKGKLEQQDKSDVHGTAGGIGCIMYMGK